MDHNSRGEPAKMGRRLSPREITVRGLIAAKLNSYPSLGGVTFSLPHDNRGDFR